MAAKKTTPVDTKTILVARSFDRRADTYTYTTVPDDYTPAEGETVLEIQVPADEPTED